MLPLRQPQTQARDRCQTPPRPLCVGTIEAAVEAATRVQPGNAGFSTEMVAGVQDPRNPGTLLICCSVSATIDFRATAGDTEGEATVTGVPNVGS